MVDPPQLTGLKVLVVEDEAIIAMVVEDMLGDMGCQVVGTAGGLAEAFAMAERESFDCAILDVNLGGQRVDPFVDLLKARGAPFIFATGYGVQGVREEDRAWPVLLKPINGRRLGEALGRLGLCRRS
ncbi:MAG: response regulator [Phenylobacterium sp.]|jgi:CheY-like chemotaxis protein|nr:response regulator [Phenylobacterium sp.]